MRKKLYMAPQTEVMNMNTVVMQAFGPASMPGDPTSAPAKRNATDAF